jgi:hypothetical protein
MERWNEMIRSVFWCFFFPVQQPKDSSYIVGIAKGKRTCSGKLDLVCIYRAGGRAPPSLAGREKVQQTLVPVGIWS